MKTVIRLLLTICSCLLAAGCATGPRLPGLPASDLFSDARFRAPAQPIKATQLFEMSPAMTAYLQSPEFQGHLRRKGPERGLVDALYTKGELKLEYDATTTRNAAETFAAKKGNCLSLVIMTAAFAKRLGTNVNFQNVLVDEQWSRSGNLYVASTHVNLTLGHRTDHVRTLEKSPGALTIDFLPPEDASTYRTHRLDEATIVAMYFNNRAAEELARHEVDEAYWFVRAAIEAQPAFTASYNTLGVVYYTKGEHQLAERVYKRALEREPEDTIVMHNLVPVLKTLGKEVESKALAARLASIDPTPPFHYFHQGMKAMEAGKFSQAKALFAREVRRSPYYHEFHFWLAIAHWRLGEARAAREQMELAVDTSTTTEGASQYSSKLNYLRSVTGMRRN